MRFIYGLLLGFFALGIACAAEGESNSFQATLRGGDLSGVVVFSISQPGELSGRAVIFHQGEQFTGKSQGEVRGDKLLLTFETAAMSAKSRVQAISGSIESPFSADLGPRKVSGTGSISLSSPDHGLLKTIGTKAIKADVVRTPSLSTR